MRIDRADAFRRLREHRTDDGVRTLCGLSLTHENARRPHGNLRCRQCARLEDRPRLETVAARRPVTGDTPLVLECLAASIAELDGTEERAARLQGVTDAPAETIISTVTAVGEASNDVTSMRLCAMAVQVLRGTRMLADLRSLCDRALRDGP